MQKEMLRQLKRINATPKMVELAAGNKKEKIYKTDWGREYKIDTVYDMMIRCQTRGLNGSRILMVCVFFPDRILKGTLSPSYEIYCNPDGSEYITRILDNGGKEQGWSEAMADNLELIEKCFRKRWFVRDAYSATWQNPEGKNTIQDFLGTDRRGLPGLIEWQRKVKKEKREEQERRQQEPWDRDMALIPEIFPSFYSWMKKDGHPNHYIFYKYDKKGAKEGYCSHCHRQVPIKAPKHNKEDKCIKCGAQITFKASSRIKNLDTGRYQAQAIQRIRGGVVIRTFSQIQDYRRADYKSPRVSTTEDERILLMDTGQIKKYYYGLYKNRHRRWILDSQFVPKKRTYYMSSTVRLYTRNLPALKKTVLKRSAIDLWEELPTDTANYLVMETEYPVIEKLAKIGMFALAEEFVKKSYINKLMDKKQTELSKMLKIDQARLKRLKTMDGKEEHLEWLQMEKLEDTIWPEEMIRDLGRAGLSPSQFYFLPQPIPYEKCWRYLKKQMGICRMPLEKTLITWRDYLNMAEQNKMDTKNDMIFRPKDVYASHQRLVMIACNKENEKEAQKLEKKWPKVNSILPKLKKFEYADEKYAILAPENILDIVREGNTLQHCVHTCDFYFDRIQRDESYLFFLRRVGARDIPWYTLEVEPSGNIRQKRTTGDNQNKDLEEAMEFLKKWQQEFQKRLNSKEKRLGKKADQARKQEYTDLRKRESRVWHGRLAGQLLADVLEQDFMAAEPLEETDNPMQAAGI